MNVRELMIENVIATNEDMTIEGAIKLLFEKHVGSLVITDNQQMCKGIFTERDALRSVAKKVPLNTHLKKVMSKNVVTIRGDASFSEARRLMVLHNIRHLPVIDEKGYLVGILTLRRIFNELFGIPTVKS